MARQPMSTQKKTLSTEEIEAQTALELPEREVIAAIGVGNFSLNIAVATAVCPAIAVGPVAAARTACAVVVVQG